MPKGFEALHELLLCFQVLMFLFSAFSMWWYLGIFSISPCPGLRTRNGCCWPPPVICCRCSSCCSWSSPAISLFSLSSRSGYSLSSRSEVSVLSLAALSVEALSISGSSGCSEFAMLTNSPSSLAVSAGGFRVHSLVSIRFSSGVFRVANESASNRVLPAAAVKLQEGSRGAKSNLKPSLAARLINCWKQAKLASSGS